MNTLRTEIHFSGADSRLGALLLATSPKGVCAILLGDDLRALRRDLQRRFPGAVLVEDRARLAPLLARVLAFIEAPAAGLDLPLDVAGTTFQQRVWRALKKIPAGTTASYADVARRINAPKSVRAVAQACGANAHALAIPCHRVVRSDGALSGYRWGVARKRALLAREAAR
jgi:AraC family transcriptional regulator of adaptative response/methylated-DNA-[protein]-cysteine methyltransferase